MAKEALVFTGAGQRKMLSLPLSLDQNGAVALQLVGAGAAVKLQTSLADRDDPAALWVDVALNDVSTGDPVASLSTNGQLGWAEVPSFINLSVLCTTYASDFTVLSNFREG